MAKRIGLFTLLTLFMLVVIAVPGEIQASYPPERETESPLPPSDVLLEEVPGEEAKAFLEKASSDPQIRLLIEALGERGKAELERAIVKRATFGEQTSTYALIPYISPRATYTLIYWVAGNCTGAMAVNKEGSYYVRAGEVRAFSVRDLLASVPSIQDILATAPEEIKSSRIRRVSGAVLPLSTDPQPLRGCPECWEVIFYQCRGPCYALNCYGYCCYDACEQQGYCALTGPCWYGYNPTCCPRLSPSR